LTFCRFISKVTRIKLKENRMKNNSQGQIVIAVLAFGLTSPMAVMAQTTVFNDTFNSGSTVQSATPAAPTANSTAYEWFQQGAAPATPTIAPGDLHLAGRTTSSSISEVEALFTTTPVALTTVGDYIDLTVVFTDTQNIWPAGTPSTLNIGLFNSGGSLPTQGVRLDASGSGTGGAVGWVGYAGRISGTNASSIYTRPAQGAGSTNPNQSQDVLFNGASGSSTYNNPVGTALSGLGFTGGTNQYLGGLTGGSTYTLDYQILLSAAGTLTISNVLYSGNSVNPANILYSEIGMASGAIDVTNSFDALALGWRFNSTSAANSIDVSSINVNVLNQVIVPEPGTVVLLGGGALMAVLLRRRQLRN
jgi:PEP-CTERM motif